MSDHYYSEKPHSAIKTDKVHCTIRNQTLTFTTSSGVFSKRGVDFGTKQLIESFIEPKVEGPFLDLGCGYGPIGITLSKSFPNRTILMADINERAVSLAKQNALENNVANVEVFQSDGFSKIEENSFAAIITNPPIRTGKRVIYPMLEESYDRLVHEGELWVVIQKKQGAPSLFAFLQTFFEEVEIYNRKKGYHIIRAIKREL